MFYYKYSSQIRNHIFYYFSKEKWKTSILTARGVAVSGIYNNGRILGWQYWSIKKQKTWNSIKMIEKLKQIKNISTIKGFSMEFWIESFSCVRKPVNSINSSKANRHEVLLLSKGHTYVAGKRPCWFLQIPSHQFSSSRLMTVTLLISISKNRKLIPVIISPRLKPSSPSSCGLKSKRAWTWGFFCEKAESIERRSIWCCFEIVFDLKLIACAYRNN